MQITINIPKEFQNDFTTDRFNDFFGRILADMHCICGNYEKETADMLKEAFRNAEIAEKDTEECASAQNKRMDAKECASAWKTVVRCYKDTIGDNNPEITMERIISELGMESTLTVFAVVAKIKSHDGRIYGKNREFMESIPTDETCTVWNEDNPVLYAGLDDIHTAHINNLITELRKRS